MNLKLACFSDFIGHNFFGTGFFFVSTSFLLVVAAAAAAVGEVNQKVASMRLKIGQPVAYG